MSVNVSTAQDRQAYLDLIRKRLGNLGTLNLLRSRNETVLWCPFSGRQNHSLEKFRLLESVLLANRIAIL